MRSGLGKAGRFLGHLSLRVIGTTIFLIVAGGVAAVLLFQRYVTPERLQSVIQAQLERTFHRPVSIRRVSMVLHQGIRVDGLEVREAPGFPGENFLSSDSLIIHYKLAALLSGRLELGLVQLISPRIELVRREDGVWNVLETLEAPPSPAKSRVSLPPLQSADMIRIEGGALRVRDLKNKAEFTLSDLRSRTEFFRTQSPFNAEFSFRSSSLFAGRRVGADVSFEGVIYLAGLRKEEAYVAAKRLVVKAGDAPIEISGSLRSFAEPRLDLRLDVPRLTSKRLSAFAPVPEGIDIPPSAWKLKVSAAPGAPPGTPLLERTYGVDLLEASVGGASLSVKGRLEGLRKLRMNASIRNLDLKRAGSWYGPWASKALGGGLNGSISFSGTVSSPSVEGLSLTLDSFSAKLSTGQAVSKADILARGSDQMRSIAVSVKRGDYSGFGQTLSNVALEAGIAGGNLQVRSFQALWNDSRVGFQGCLRPLSDPKQIVGDLTLDKLVVDRFYSAVEAMVERGRKKAQQPPKPRPWAQVFKYSIPRYVPDLRGRIRVAEASSPNFHTKNLQLLFDLRGVARGLRRANGDFRISFGPGQVDRVPEVRSANKLLNVLLLPYTYMHEMSHKAAINLDHATPDTYDFNRNDGDFAVEDGIVGVRRLSTEGPDFLAYADGKLDFVNEKIDARVLMRLTRKGAALPERLVDSAGRLSMELLLTDNLNKPKVELTLRKMGGADIEDALAQAAKRAKPLEPPAGAGSCGEK